DDERHFPINSCCVDESRQPSDPDGLCVMLRGVGRPQANTRWRITRRQELNADWLGVLRVEGPPNPDIYNGQDAPVRVHEPPRRPGRRGDRRARAPCLPARARLPRTTIAVERLQETRR